MPQAIANNSLTAITKDKDVSEQPQWITGGLVGHIRSRWEQMKMLKVPIEQQDFKNKRQKDGIYDPDKMAAIKEANSSEVYVQITGAKCRHAEALTEDIMRSVGDTLWMLTPSKSPKLNPEMEAIISQWAADSIMQSASQHFVTTGQMPPQSQIQEMSLKKADEIAGMVHTELERRSKEKAKRMADKIEAQLTEGGFYKALKEVTSDVITYQCGIMKGPVFRNKKKFEWIKDEQGKWNIQINEMIAPEFDRISPFDFYTIDSTLENDCIERHRYNRIDLITLLGVEGYKDDYIRAVLNEYGTGGLREWLWTDTERTLLEKKTTDTFQTEGDKIDCLEYWGYVRGKMLLEWGIAKKEVPDEDKDYQINAFLIGNYCIKAVVNPDALGRKPYYITSFVKTPSSIYGQGLPQTITDVQGTCNSIARAMVNNMAMASQPQVEVNIDRFPAGTDFQHIWAGRIWPSNSKQMQEGQSVRVTNITCIINELLPIYNQFSRLADEHSGVPAFAHGGSNVGGAGNTASGLSMLRADSAKGFNMFYTQRDDDIITPCIKALYDYNMEFDEDEAIKGDLRIVVRGAAAIIAKEQKTVRLTEFLNNTNNPTDLQIIGLQGRARLIKENLRSLIDNVDEIIPEDMLEKNLSAPTPQAPNTGTPAKAGTTLPDGSQPGGGEMKVFDRAPRPAIAG